MFEEGTNPCPKCRERGEDRAGDNFHFYGEGLGGHCFSCGYTIPSDEYVEETNLRVKGDKNVIKESDIKKMEEKSFTEDELQEFHSKTVDALDPKYKYRGLDTSVC